MSNPVPRLDLSQITFPTDQLTVRDIRQEWYRTASDSFERTQTLVLGLESLIDTERELAELAFYKALGIPAPEGIAGGIGGAEGAREVLEAEYQQRGIAMGEKVAEQLVRSIEAQAISQAAKIIGRLPE